VKPVWIATTRKTDSNIGKSRWTLLFMLMGWDYVSGQLPPTGLLFISQMVYMSTENPGGMMLAREDRRTRRRTYPSATLSTTNPAGTDPSTNPGLRYEKTTTNRLSHDTVQMSLASATGCEDWDGSGSCLVTSIDWGCLKTGLWKEYFWPKRDEVTEEWRELHSEELHN
jgi:hypothetical protein